MKKKLNGLLCLLLIGGAVCFLGSCSNRSKPEPALQARATSTTNKVKAETTRTAKDKHLRGEDGEEGKSRRRNRRMDFELDVFFDGKLKATIGPAVFEKLTLSSFRTAWGGEAFGPRLSEVLKEAGITKGKKVKVSGSGKHAGVAELVIPWEDVQNEDHRLTLALTSRGALKLVGSGEKYASREMQVHDIFKIEVTP